MRNIIFSVSMTTRENRIYIQTKLRKFILIIKLRILLEILRKIIL